MTSRKALVIEDDPDIALGVAIRLKAAGFEIVFSADACMAQTVALRERPDLVILDLGLPGGDGFTVLSRLKSNPNTALVPVVVLTARDAAFKERALAAGAAAFLQKPVTGDVLMQTIDDAFAVLGFQ